MHACTMYTYTNEAIVEVQAEECGSDGVVGTEVFRHHRTHNRFSLRARGVVEADREIGGGERDGEEEDEK